MDTDAGQETLGQNDLEVSPLEVSPLKELQSSLKELKSIYASMEQRLKELEELAEHEDTINSAMDWVFTHCQVDSDGKFQVGDTTYTWISFLKYIILNKIDFKDFEQHMVPTTTKHNNGINKAQ
jgi:hypothetical protein